MHEPKKQQQHQHRSSGGGYKSPEALQIAAGLDYLFRARKCFSPSNLLTLHKAEMRPSLEYCSHIWGAAAPTTLSREGQFDSSVTRP
nr:unnamed protein product [Callosobruchus chinensis]